MNKDAKRLFDLVRESKKSGISDMRIIAEIKADSALLASSNSYCRQSGHCCNTRCANLEKIDGKAFCMLHDNGNVIKKAADYDEILTVLNPDKYRKPEVCRTYGPHIGLLALIDGNENIRCEGAIEMFANYNSEKEKST
jgi:hypothetical protein